MVRHVVLEFSFDKGKKDGEIPCRVLAWSNRTDRVPVEFEFACDPAVGERAMRRSFFARMADEVSWVCDFSYDGWINHLKLFDTRRNREEYHRFGQDLGRICGLFESADAFLDSFFSEAEKNIGWTIGEFPESGDEYFIAYQGDECVGLQAIRERHGCVERSLETARKIADACRENDRLAFGRASEKMALGTREQITSSYRSLIKGMPFVIKASNIADNFPY